MASGTRSSKRKSSPSLKKKRRTKDLSKKRRKIRKGKSKKVSRRESPDSYSDNESLSSASSVSYSSTDSGSRRSRSRTRKDTSKRRKKSRGSRLRIKSIENAINERRGKRSKKSKDTDAKKKRLRKKRRREPSISSSSRSVSCSTCRSSEDSEREHQKTEKGVKRRGSSRRDLGEDRRWRRGHSRSRSPSSCRLDGGDGIYLSEEQRLVENNPRRLRSIIIFAKEFEEEEEDTELIDKDVHKEEIIYDRDDYPSPRSNDSHDGDDPRKETSPESTGYLENQRAKLVGSKIGISELSEACHLGLVDHGVNASAADGADVGDSFEGHEANVSSANAGSNHADLEAVLRQKALENLKKFKGGMRANAKKHVSTKSSCDIELKQSSGLISNSELQKKDQEGSVGGVGILSVPHQYMSTVDRHSSRTMEESSALSGSAAEILPILPQDLKMVNPSKEGSADVDRLEGGEGEASDLKEGNFGADKLAEEALPTQDPPLTNMLTTESLSLASRDDKGLTDSSDGVKDKHETGASELIQRLGSNKPGSQMISTEESSMPMSVPTQSKDTVESVQPSHDTKMVTDDVEKTATGVVPTSLASNLEGQSSNAQGNEDGDSQFQQKTMSVMRGGEMVQVSYKVYIPKHVPALARRKLKR